MISVFEVEDEDHAERVAAALAISAPQSQRYIFVGASRSSLEAEGMELQNSNGDTRHGEVDSWHRDLLLPSHHSVESAVKLFLSGEIIPVDKGTVSRELETAIRGNQFDWALVSNLKPFQQRLPKLVGTSIRLEGIPA